MAEKSENVIPRTLDTTTLKMWQRYCAAKAVFEVFERPKSDNLDKFGYVQEAYKRLVAYEIIIRTSD